MPAPTEAEDETKVVDRESKLSAEVSAGDASPSPSESGQADLVAAHPLVGRYEVIHRLGHGGMASVYLGRAIGTAGFERVVAVKVIHPHLAQEPEFVEMFLDEARIAAKIHHPNVVEILDLGQDEDLFFMVMEYVEGETLSALLRQLGKAEERLPLACALQIVVDACKGLAAAHDLVDRDGRPLKLVHRDVSPHNLLVSMDGRVKVVDFGIMKAAGKRSSTLTGQLRGKIAYMAPEQARSTGVDRRADVFALGAVLWEMVTGKRLFTGESEAETLDKVLHHEVPDVHSVRDDMPEALGEILRRSLAPDPADRYASAQGMLKDIRTLLRKVQGEEEPRELLAMRMAKHFAKRIEYVRATMRGSATNLRDPNARSSGLLAANEISKTTPLGSASSPLRLTPSVAPLQTATVTSVTPGGARSWMLWLLLPLAGAAIGTLAVSSWLGDRADAQQTAQAQGARAARVGDAPDSSTKEDKLVAWVINSEPQGATILIDGKPHDEVTPTIVKLPRSEKTVLVVAEHEGYKRSQALRLAPLTSQNLPTLRLDALASETKPSAIGVTHPAPVLKANSKKGSRQGGKHGRHKAPKEVPPPSDAKPAQSNDGPKFKPMPVFDDDDSS